MIKSAFVVALSMQDVKSLELANTLGFRFLEEACLRLQQEFDKNPEAFKKFVEENDIKLPPSGNIAVSEFTITEAYEFLT